jgi:hypothetical protein
MTAIMSEPAIFIYVTAFLALFLFCIGVSQFVRQRSTRRVLIEKIKSGSKSIGTLSESPVEISEKPKAGAWIINAFGKLGKFISTGKSQDYSSARLKFLRAGIRNEKATASFWGAKISLMICLAVIFIILRFWIFNIMSYQMTVMTGVLSALLGFYLTSGFGKKRTNARKKF